MQSISMREGSGEVRRNQPVPRLCRADVVDDGRRLGGDDRTALIRRPFRPVAIRSPRATQSAPRYGSEGIDAAWVDPVTSTAYRRSREVLWRLPKSPRDFAATAVRITAVPTSNDSFRRNRVIAGRFGEASLPNPICRPSPWCNADCDALASRLRASRIETRVTKQARVAGRLSKSLASRRFRPNQVRSTIQRRSMPYEGSLMLGQIDQARRNLYGIGEDPAVIPA